MIKDEDLEILKQVTLLGIYKKEKDESLSDVRKSLIDTGMYDKKEAKEIFRLLREDECITDESLTLKGITLAKEAEILFKQYG
jgi:hypothetical protein